VNASPAAHQSWTRPLRWSFVDGEFLEGSDAAVSMHAHALSYGTGTFEGIRGSWNSQHEQLYLLEPLAHYERMAQSARILGLDLPYSAAELVDITAELVRKNEVRSDVYARPLFLLGGEELPVRMHGVRTRFSIGLSAILQSYINATAGARCMVSSWRRSPDVVLPSRAKLTGSYVGPALAKTEAVQAGYDEAIMLNMGGHVAEATTSNIFIRRSDRWATPGHSEDILEGITRRQVMTLLAEEQDVVVEERTIDRSELYVADEIFLTGTAAQIVPVASVDARQVGPGRPRAMSAVLAGLLDQISRREIATHSEWTVPVFAEVAVS
jgi:branched-chain amino acid aminotransferase